MPYLTLNRGERNEMNTLLSYVIALIAALGLSPLTAKIVDLDRSTDTVAIETASGIRFAFYGCEDYCEGDYVSAILWNNGTPHDCRDDIIVSVHYSGYSDYAGGNLN